MSNHNNPIPMEQEQQGHDISGPVGDIPMTVPISSTSSSQTMDQQDDAAGMSNANGKASSSLCHQVQS